MENTDLSLIGEDDSGNALDSWRTDAEGRFSFSGFRAGIAYKFQLRHRHASSPWVIGQPGEIVPEQVLVSYRDAGFEGVATDDAGKVIPNTRITVRGMWGDDRSNTFIHSMMTNEFGEFDIWEIPGTLLYVEMTIGDNSATPLTWRSDIEVPEGEVAMLGTVPFAPEQAPNKKRRSMLALGTL